jgi:sterol desaturase/sphingolipid hydroxylase (fatty acid hydroxylase superfamily)
MNRLERFLENPPGFLQLTTGITIDLALRYLFFAGVAWLLGYVLFKRRWFHRKIVPKLPESTEVRREFAYSMVSILIFGVTGTATLLAGREGWTQMYWRVSERGWGWFWLSLVCAILIHDAYFYWTHRAMHHPRLFPLFHRVHHLSTNPSPWAAYSFSPLEGIVQTSIFPLVTLLVPIHPLAFGLVMIWQITFNVLGHTGYEFHPRGLMDSWLKRILNTPTNHIQHHEKMRGNYGLYFNIWDRLMGTNHAGYEDRFREVTSRPAPARANAPATRPVELKP